MKHLHRTTLGLAALGLATLGFVLAQENRTPPHPLPKRLVIVLDGTGSLTAPSQVNAGLTLQQVLYSFVPELLMAARAGGSSELVVFVTCDAPYLELRGENSRRAQEDVKRVLEYAKRDCTRPGTRLDLTWRAIADLDRAQPADTTLVAFTDGITETATALALEDGWRSLEALKGRSLDLIAFVGLRKDVRLSWELAASGLGARATVVGGSTDVRLTVDRIRDRLRRR